MLKYKVEVFTMIFATIAVGTDDRKYSTFQNINGLKTDSISELAAEPLSVRNLERRIDKPETLIKAISYGIPIAVAIAGIIWGVSQNPSLFFTPSGP